MLFDDDRMHTQRGVQRFVLSCQRQHAAKTLSRDGWNDNSPDAGLRRTRQAGDLICRKGKIKVTVGIDKTVRHARSSRSKLGSFAGAQE